MRTASRGAQAYKVMSKAAPDGHTLLGIGHFNAINATLYRKLPFDLKRDFATVRHAKPAASRQDSAELYVLATGFRGRADDQER